MLHPHNLYLMFWLSTGITGLMVFLWIVTCGFLNMNKSQPFIIAASALLVYLLVHGFIDMPFWKNDLAMQFWLILAAMRVLK